MTALTTTAAHVTLTPTTRIEGPHDVDHHPSLTPASDVMPFSVVLRGGSGDDAFNVSKAVKNLTIEGGEGTDTIRITQTNFYNQQAFSHFIGGRVDDTTSFVISDFEAGAGGDFLDISPLLLLLDSSYDGNNPFGNYLYLEASGTDSILSVDLDGAIEVLVRRKGPGSILVVRETPIACIQFIYREYVSVSVAVTS